MVARDKEDLSGQQIGNYEIESHIAARKASDLFLARDVKLERLVFLEVLRTTAEEDENLAARFRRRMETVSQLKEPSIAVVSDLDITDDGFPYAVIDYFPGTTLADRLAELNRTQGPMPVIEALELAKQLAQALGVAHAAGLIHHDLRPENIMLREDGAPVLIDLGLPIVLDPAAPGVNGAASEMLDYASPEELEGKGITRRSNIYSFGVLLYELLSGHRPKLPVLPFDIFPQANMPKEEPLEEARPGLAGETYRLVRNCLWRQEWSRFETADELITAIETAIFAEQELPKAATWTPKPNRSFLVIIPVALLVLGLLGFLILRNARSGQAEAEDTPAAETTPGDVAGVATNDPAVTPSPTATATIELATESAGEVAIPALSPGPGREFTVEDTIDFDWYWPPLPQPGQHFALYLIDGDQEYKLGALTEPNNGISYRLTVDGADIPVTGENLGWQVRLENITGGGVEVASDVIPIIIRALTPTPSPTGTAAPATPTVTPTLAEACVVSPPPGWVLYTIRTGDSLSNLSERANIPVEDLIAVNCLPNDLLSVGQQVWVPLAAVPRTPTPPSVNPTSAPPPPTAGGSTPEPRPPTTTTQPEPATDTPEPATDTPEPPTKTPPVQQP
ncbi:MAG: protein kinase [Candidatus Promineofilum sp.]|nr:protein kinase [Promineifilum sp.]MCW5861524.1 protein kinase [Anaerolineae bacterium]